MLCACDHTEPVRPYIQVASVRFLLRAVTDGRVGSLPAQRSQESFRSPLSPWRSYLATFLPLRRITYSRPNPTNAGISEIKYARNSLNPRDLW